MSEMASESKEETVQQGEEWPSSGDEDQFSNERIENLRRQLSGDDKCALKASLDPKPERRQERDANEREEGLSSIWIDTFVTEYHRAMVDSTITHFMESHELPVYHLRLACRTAQKFGNRCEINWVSRNAQHGHTKRHLEDRKAFGVNLGRESQFPISRSATSRGSDTLNPPERPNKRLVGLRET